MSVASVRNCHYLACNTAVLFPVVIQMSIFSLQCDLAVQVSDHVQMSPQICLLRLPLLCWMLWRMAVHAVVLRQKETGLSHDVLAICKSTLTPGCNAHSRSGAFARNDEVSPRSWGWRVPPVSSFEDDRRNSSGFSTPVMSIALWGILQRTEFRLRLANMIYFSMVWPNGKRRWSQFA